MYTPPVGTAANFTLEAYTPPAGTAANFEFIDVTPGPTTTGAAFLFLVVSR